jgi:hypothetical protein
MVVTNAQMLSESHKLLLSSLTAYYSTNSHHKERLREIITGGSVLSLRILDWFVTHYARKHHIVYFIDDAKNEYSTSHASANMRKFNVYLEYRAQLQSYTKLFFDSFRRHERITFVLSNTPLSTIETTVGQLNFFRWAFKNNIVDYILQHISVIEEAMAEYQKKVRSVTPVAEHAPADVPQPKPIQGAIYVKFD